MNAQKKLKLRFEKNFHICVGLDTDIDKIPAYIKKSKNPVVEFNKIVIENTYEESAAFKINFAFYERDGIRGIENLLSTIELIPKDLLIIADAKRGDIGNTSQMYAESVFKYFNCDAVTLHPYMGYDSLEPFLQFEDRLNFILALTSNKGAEDFEKLQLRSGVFLYQKVIEQVKKWNKNNNCGIVFGATNLDELKENVKYFDELPILLPGVGTQGGNMNEIVKVFKSINKTNYLINVSRALIYCDDSLSFPISIKKSIKEMNAIVNN